MSDSLYRSVPLTPEQERLYDRLYELAEDAHKAGLLLWTIIEAVTNGCSSAEVDGMNKYDEGP